MAGLHLVDANREVRVNETFPVQTYDELTENEFNQVEADDQAIQTILLGLPEDIYAAVDSCETAQEIWLRVQQMMKGSDIRIQEKRLSCLMNRKVQNVRNQVVQNAVQNLGVQNVENQNGLIVVLGIANQNPNRNGNVVVARAEGNEIWNNTRIQLQAKEFDLMAATANLDEIEEVNENCILTANLQRASTSAEQYTELLEPIHEPHQVQQNDSNVISEVSSMEQDGGTVDQHPVTAEETNAYFNSLYNNLAMEVEKLSKEKSIVSSLLEEKKKLKSGFKIREDELLDKKIQLEDKIKNANFKIQFLKEAAKFVRDFQALANKANESLAKHKALELEIERLLRRVGLSKIDETHALSKSVTSKSVPTPQESKVMKNDNVITPGMFRIIPFKPYREDKSVPNKVRASTRTKPITIS
nr:hypothetical protein [Tanacetum cinerariifolium]